MSRAFCERSLLEFTGRLSIYFLYFLGLYISRSGALFRSDHTRLVYKSHPLACLVRASPTITNDIPFTTCFLRSNDLGCFSVRPETASKSLSLQDAQYTSVSSYQAREPV